MKKRANNVFVGIFLLVGFAGFLYILFNISGGTGIFSRNYSLFAKFTHVKGLNYGSEVSLVGLRVGTVKRILVPTQHEQDLQIELSLTKEYQDRIREDSIATIKTSGILGDKYIEITIGSPDKAMLKDGDSIKSDEPKDFFSKTGDVVEGISKKLDRGGELDQLIHHLNKLSANLAETTSDLKSQTGLWYELTKGKSGTNLNKSMEHLESILRKIDKGEGTMGSLINDPTVYEDIKSLMGGAKRSAVLKYFMKQFIDSGEKEKEEKK